MKEKFESRRLHGSIKIFLKEKREHWIAEKSEVCEHIGRIVTKYRSKGYRLTLRQLYYQLVAGEFIPNHDKVYKKLSSILGDLRMAGRIDWDSIEDRGRVPSIPYWVKGIADALNDTASHYRLDRQKGQNNVVEVWTEKDAISGILKRVTQRFHVRLVVNKGYSSASAMYRSYRRFIPHINEGKKVTILYFGDHDPSGLDMIRDIRERVETFIACGDLLDSANVNEWWLASPHDHWSIYEEYGEDYPAVDKVWEDRAEEDDYHIYHSLKARMYLKENELFQVVPIGLTMDQIKDFNPPPNPAKLTDPRAKWYVKQFGPVSWEVDAIEPDLMVQIVTEGIEKVIDLELYKSVVEQEQKEIHKIQLIAEQHNEEE